jgi:type IV fimbrial biogenesis protein FimT
MHTRTHQRGVTLAELSTVTAIAATVLTTAIPSFNVFMERRTLEGVAGELSTDLQFIRSEAVRQNRSLRVSFQQLTGGSCYVIHTGSSADCHCSGDAPAVCTGDAESVKTVYVAAQRGVQILANQAGISYDPVRGTASPWATVRVVGNEGRAIHHVVSIMGRVKTCSPQHSMAGYKAC